MKRLNIKTCLKPVSLLGLLILLTVWPSDINLQVEKYTSSVLHQMRGPRSPEIDVLFIFLDSKDIADFGGWPITRDYYGYLVHALDSVATKTIVIDILFPRMAHYDPGLDEATAEMFFVAGNVILPKVFDEITKSGQEIPEAFAATFPAPLYQDAAAGIGFANLGRHETNGTIPLIANFDGQKSFSLGVRAAAQHMNATPETESDERLLLVDNVDSTVLSIWQDELMPNYLGGLDDVPQIGFIQFLQQYPQLVDSMDFSKTLVFVGLTAPGLPVLTSNPFEENYPASLLHLTVAENLISGTGLVRMPVWQQLLMWIILLMGAIWLLGRKWDWQSLAGGSILLLAILLMSYLSFCHLYHIPPMFYQLLFVSIMMTWAFAESYQTKINEQDLAAKILKSTIKEKTIALTQTRASLLELTGKISAASGEHDKLQVQIEEHQSQVSILEKQLRDLQAGELETVNSPVEFAGIIHSAKGKMAELLQLVQRVSAEEIPVLISGETGTGKELIASAIHQNSPRNNKTFVAVNCGAIAENLLESELFGHEKGSFTGAHSRRRGRFELADGGSIFLDEITETSLAFQSRLLRVLQEGSFERLGGEKAITVDVRVIAASNRNIEDQIRAGEFREDLYYRLNGFPLQLPPLRERGDDIVLLSSYFLEKQGKDVVGISQEALEKLQQYHWPGNVRELENVIRRAAILAGSEGRTLIRISDLAEELHDASGTVQQHYLGLDSHVLEHLRSHDFSRSAITLTAKALGNRDRGTITEYLRGMCFKALQENDFDVDLAAQELAGKGASEKSVSRVRAKIERYLQNLPAVSEVDTTDFDPRQQSAFRGLPAVYHPALVAVIRHFRPPK